MSFYYIFYFAHLKKNILHCLPDINDSSGVDDKCAILGFS